MTTPLKCAECNEMFEVSNETAEAMHRWREVSGEPFLCGACAGVDEIDTNTTTVARNVVVLTAKQDLRNKTSKVKCTSPNRKEI